MRIDLTYCNYIICCVVYYTIYNYITGYILKDDRGKYIDELDYMNSSIIIGHIYIN